MLVYANHLSFQGHGAEAAVFKGIGGWLKEQLGFGLHPDQVKKDGEFNGTRGNVHSMLRIRTTTEDDPKLYSWVLKHPDDTVLGRRWIIEVGFKGLGSTFVLSCIVKTDDRSTLVARSVMASQPRMIRYVVNNVQHANDADLATSVPGVAVKTVGPDTDSYHNLLAEIERQGREGPIVLVSPTRDGDYLLKVRDLQQTLIGLAQVVQVSRNSNSYEMAEVLGEAQSAWGGAVNVLYMPSLTRPGRARYFLAADIADWGDTQHKRISQVLAWVTNNTNIPHLRKHVRPEGVMLLAQRRLMHAERAKREQMDAAQLRLTLEEASRGADEQAKYFAELVDENSQLETSVSEFKGNLEDARKDSARAKFTIDSLEKKLASAGGGQSSGIDAEDLLDLVCRTDLLSPLECIDLIEKMYGDRCTVLASAKDSARKMDRFVYGRQLLGLLKQLVTDYRSKLMDGGDNEARKVFGKNDYAAKESETLMASRAMRRQRTFEYEGQQVAMFRHLKIGVDDDATKTIRVHFHWDAGRKIMVIGYCGGHLPISSR